MKLGGKVFEEGSKSTAHAITASTTASSRDDELVAVASPIGLERAEGSDSMENMTEVAQQEFYSMMLAAGRADLVSSAEFSAADIPDNGKSERESFAPAAAAASPATVAVPLRQPSSGNLPRRISGLSTQGQKRQTADDLGPNTPTAPGAYDEGPGRPSIRMVPSFGGQSSLGRQSTIGDISGESEEEKEEEASDQDGRNNNKDYKLQATEDATASETNVHSSSSFMEFGEMGMLPRMCELDSIPHTSLVEAHTVDDIVEVNAKPIEWWTPRKISCLVMGSLIIVAVIVTATVLSLKSQNNPLNTPAPTPEPTLSPSIRLEAIQAIITATGEDFAATAGTNATTLRDANSPQYKALQWLALGDPLRVLERDLDHIRQRYSLAVLYFSTGGASNWAEQYEFLLPTHECTWSGALHCDQDVVTGIELTDNNLIGRLPPEIGLLSGLRSITLDDNQLTGPLPSVLPPNLERLDIWNNELVGSIPTNYASMTELESFRVGKNALTGTIPVELGGLTKLTALSLESNRLTGSIPGIWNLTHMRDFRIGQQSLTGTLSPLVGRWINTTVFHANKLNGINGTIPTEFGLLTQLTSLKLSQNHLSGELPSELGNLHDISLLALSRNGITGTVPTELARLSNLEELYLQNTWLTGNLSYICSVKEGRLPLLHTFNADLEEVNCPCCTCCFY